MYRILKEMINLNLPKPYSEEIIQFWNRWKTMLIYNWESKLQSFLQLDPIKEQNSITLIDA